MLRKIEEKKNIWIDIVNPQESDIKYLENNFEEIEPGTLFEIPAPSLRSKVETTNNYLYIAYHMPVYDNELKTSREVEIDFIAMKNILITVRYEKINPLENIFEAAEKDKQIRENILSKGPSYLLYKIINDNLEFSLRQLIHIKNKIKDLGDNIFKGREKKMIGCCYMGIIVMELI